MFQDLFDEAGEAGGFQSPQVQSSYDRQPRSCADSLPAPDFARQPGYPIGLKNQGATCYLNSLLQILFHTPELRKTILDLPLCKQTPQDKTDFLNSSKHKFMLGFQRLFSEMSVKDTFALSTQYLKEAFGWEGSEHIVQHDIEEAMKIIFDTFERALVGTPYEKNIRLLFKGVSSRYKSCRTCTVTEERLEDFYGLNLQVQNCSSLEQSIMSYLNAESMDGANQVYCEACQEKRDMWLGSKLKVLPNILAFTLTRFAFDYERLDRVKLNTFFSFNLENSFAHLLDEEADANYELYGVLIHRGSAHSGHYYCYIRDTMHESDWRKGLQDAQKQQQQQLKKQQEKDQLLTEEQKTRKAERNKEDKQFVLVEPCNKAVKEGWFQIDDSRVTAIDAKKITTKYEGSDSAYILFYRKKGLSPPTDIPVPEYFGASLRAQNQLLDKQRQEYQNKKQQIVLKIDGSDQTLSINTKISDLLAVYCPVGYTLINEAKHNGLPYYPKELNSLKEYTQADTVKSLDLIHESVWTKYEIDSDAYREIQPLIEVGRRPFEINVFFNESNEKMVVYQDQTLSDLRLRLEKKYDMPYETQIIKVVTAYREYFVTDELANDDVLLTKLGFIHECQAVLKKLQKGEDVDSVKKTQEKVETNTLCFVIERDDVFGIKRMYFEKEKTLQELFNFVVESEDLDPQTKRRFRNLNGDRLFYDDQYEKKLSDLNLDEEIVKIRIERGDIPVKGDICVIAKVQSKFQAEQGPKQIESIFDPNATILQVKAKLCELAGLAPEMHRLYQTDWMGQPARSITKEKQSIFDARFGKEEKICIRDIQSPIGAELIVLQVYQTKVGTPEDVGDPIGNIKIEEHKTLKDLKHQILKLGRFVDSKDIEINQLRVREIKKDYMFGSIMRENNKDLKNYVFSANKIVVQVLPSEEQLTDSQIVLVLKQRNKEKRTYQNHKQLIFEAGKAPSLKDLDLAIKSKLQLPEDEKIKIAKYVHYDFEWIELSEKYIQDFIKGKTKEPKGDNNKNKPKGKEGKKQLGKEVSKLQAQEANQQAQTEQVDLASKPQSAQQNVTKGQTHENTKEDKPEKIPAKQADQNRKNNNKQKKQRKQKQQGKAKGKEKQKQSKPKQLVKRQDCLNLRKAPYLLKDGDWVGYGLASQLQGDDLQTDEDLTLKLLKKNEKAVAKRRGGPEQVFKVNIDF